MIEYKTNSCFSENKCNTESAKTFYNSKHKKSTVISFKEQSELTGIVKRYFYTTGHLLNIQKLNAMNVEEFRDHGKEVIDYICDYAINIEKRDVAPTLDPGYLKFLMPG